MVKKVKRSERNWDGGGLERRKGGLFHELSKGIKGLINFPLDTRNKEPSEGKGGCHKRAHVRLGSASVNLEEFKRLK